MNIGRYSTHLPPLKVSLLSHVPPSGEVDNCQAKNFVHDLGPHTVGWPRSIRSEGGPQFRGEFADFCAKFQFKHKASSQYNSCAKGSAESAVKTVKNMLKKCLKKFAARTWLFSFTIAFWQKAENAAAPARLGIQTGGF